MSEREHLYPQEEFRGVTISIKCPGRPRSGREDFSGMCHGAGSGGSEAVSPTKSNTDQAGRQFDMDAATGFTHHPGTAGAHPIMQPDYESQLSRTQGPIGVNGAPGSTTGHREKTGPAFMASD